MRLRQLIFSIEKKYEPGDNGMAASKYREKISATYNAVYALKISPKKNEAKFDF